MWKIKKGGEIVEIVHKAQNEKVNKDNDTIFKNNNLDYADFVGFLGVPCPNCRMDIIRLVTIFV